jgi:hypothetical protein
MFQYDGMTFHGCPGEFLAAASGEGIKMSIHVAIVVEGLGGLVIT